jgi:hypothetical protein
MNQWKSWYIKDKFEYYSLFLEWYNVIIRFEVIKQESSIDGKENYDKQNDES